MSTFVDQVELFFLLFEIFNLFSFVSQCRSSSFYVHTPTRPLIQLNCANLLFAPYNASHSELLDQMERAGLCKEFNLWNKPLVTHPAGYVDEQPWTLLPPDDFYPISSIRLEDQHTVYVHSLINMKSIFFSFHRMVSYHFHRNINRLWINDRNRFRH